MMRWLFADRFLWLLLLNSYALYVFIPTILFCFWFLANRHWRWLTIAALPLLIFISLISPKVWTPPPPSSGQPLRVLTFNVLYDNPHYAEIAELIRSQQPDLVALQEVQPAAMRELVAQLEEEFPHYLLGTDNPYGTTALFSRLPIVDVRTLDLEVDRPAVMMRITVGEQRLTVVSAHLRPFGWPTIQYLYQHESLSAAIAAAQNFVVEQNRQAQILLELMQQSPDDAFILGCDCNTKLLQSTYALLHAQLRSPVHEIGLSAWFHQPPMGYVDLNPQNVDYIFYTGALSPVAVYKLKANAGSDHNPLVSEFLFTAQ